MPVRRESVGKALRRALGEEVVLAAIEPRRPGVSYLMNERRLRIFEAVFNDPGIHVRELQRLLRIPLQSLRWHVSVLASSGLVEVLRIGNRESLFTAIPARAAERASRAIARDARYTPIIDALSKGGEVSVSEITKAIGSYQQLVSARLKALLAAGLVERVGEGARRKYRLSPIVARKEAALDAKSQRESLLALFRDQGLVPRVVAQSSGMLSIVIDRGTDELDLKFKLSE